MAAVRGRYKRNRHILGEPLTDFRRRALGVLALNEGRSVEDISGVLRVTVPPVYKWARAWRERGLMGMLSGHVGGPPRKLTAELLDVAEQIARQEAPALGQIARKVHELHPEAPTFSVDRLSVGLRARGSFKINRLTLEKKRNPQRFETMQVSLNKLREAAKDKDKGIELLYFDETGIANVPNVGGTQ